MSSTLGARGSSTSCKELPDKSNQYNRQHLSLTGIRKNDNNNNNSTIALHTVPIQSKKQELFS